MLGILLLKAQNDLGKNKIQNEKCTKDDEGDKEDDRDVVVAGIHVVVHVTVRPVLERENLEDRQNGVTDVVKINQVEQYVLVLADIINVKLSAGRYVVHHRPSALVDRWCRSVGVRTKHANQLLAVIIGFTQPWESAHDWPFVLN